MDPIFNLFKNRTKTIFLSSKHANLPLNMSTLMNCRNVKSVELLFCVSNYEGLLLSTTPKSSSVTVREIVNSTKHKAMTRI